MKTAIGVGGGLGVAAAYALFVRPRMLRWGATDEELARHAPGAAIAPAAKLFSTMATTIDAPPSAVWPWLAQMGYDRAGWYSWDLLDHFGIPSADRLHPEWQALTVGQHLQSTPDGKHWFEVAAVEPERSLVLRFFATHGRQVDPPPVYPEKFTDSLWEFILEPLSGDRTRLIVKTYAIAQPKGMSGVLGFLFWEPAHFIMQTRQFSNLKRRIERAPRRVKPEAVQPLPLEQVHPPQPAL